MQQIKQFRDSTVKKFTVPKWTFNIQMSCQSDLYSPPLPLHFLFGLSLSWIPSITPNALPSLFPNALFPPSFCNFFNKNDEQGSILFPRFFTHHFLLSTHFGGEIVFSVS
jgi:hypothetical protein